MIKERAWPVRAMYILVALAMAMSLIIMAAPAQKVSAQDDEVKAEWTMVDTPTTADWLLAPESTIIDYALASAGDVAYAIIYGYDEDWANEDYYLLKSDDGAATWDDLNDELDEAVDLDGGDYISELVLVATDWEDPDFVAVALYLWEQDAAGSYLHVFFSNDGGETFEDGDRVEDSGFVFEGPVSDLAVSLEVDGERDIAIAGEVCCPTAAIFRCTVDGDSAGPWEDATDYDGWDDDGAISSYIVTDLIFSPEWETDRTILAVTVDDWSWSDGYAYGAVYLQIGVWGESSAAWNEQAGFAPAVLVIEDVYIPDFLGNFDARAIAGVALPEDYSSTDTDTRVCWVWVNYFDDVIDISQGEIFRVRDDAVDSVDTQIVDMPWLTNVSYLGTIAEGKAIAGVLAESQPYPLTIDDLDKECCEGVQVFRNAGITNMEICCLEWDKACKPPTGLFAMAVSYVSDDKAYAVALGGQFDFEEGAWSVSFDDGDVWNQLSLIDTYIDYFSDTAVSPDCNKTFLVSVNLGIEQVCGCDSVWVYADEFPEFGYSEYSGHWLRTWCGSLEGSWFEGEAEGGLLRLPPASEETTGDTVYLVDIETNTVYYNPQETLACWERGTAPFGAEDGIMDLAVLDEATIYALSHDGDVAMSDDHGKTLTWSDTVDSELDTFGWSIAVHGDYVLVGGQDGEVSYTDDFLAEEPEFTLLEEVSDIECHVTVAFDTYFDENDVIYAALEGWDGGYSEGGIYSFVIGSDDEEWTDLEAWHGVGYTGIVLSFDATGNPFTSPETGGVLYASFVGWGEGEKTGVARCLTPLAGGITCSDCHPVWDYLMESDPDDWFYGVESIGFEAAPDALKMCGCLDADSNTKLFAIDSWWDYDMVDGDDGTVWTFEDCYAKKAVEITYPGEGATIATSSCECCNTPFTVKWDQLCDACSYEIQFAYDAEFAEVVELITPDGDVPDSPDFYLVTDVGLDGAFYAYNPANGANPSAFLGCYFLPEETYYMRIRAAGSGDQEIHSWWSDAQSFTIEPTASAGAIELVSPVPGAIDRPTKNVGFSWNMLAEADTFDWKLDDNADFSSTLATKTGLTAKATSHAGPLTHGTTYYWQVTAYKDGSAISVSAVGTFTTSDMGPFCAQDGVCFDTLAELEEYNAEHFPTDVGTPFWVWVVIAIGAVLVIVVIVLIFRTRRV